MDYFITCGLPREQAGRALGQLRAADAAGTWLGVMWRWARGHPKSGALSGSGMCVGCLLVRLEPEGRARVEKKSYS